MGRVIAVASGKGGTGKSTAVCGLGASLALAGHSVCLIDLDIELRKLDMLLGLSDMAAADFTDLLSGACEPESAIIRHPYMPGLHLLAAPARSPAPEIDAAAFVKMCEELKEKFDFCFIDCPAGLGFAMELVCPAADSCILVSTPDYVALRDAQRVSAAFARAGIKDVKLIVNRVNRKNIKKGLAPDIDDAIDSAGSPLIGVVPEDIKILRGQLRFSSGRKKGAALAFANIAARLTGKHVPVMKI